MSDSQLDPLAGCRAYLEAHRLQTTLPDRPNLPLITISREAGAGAVTVGGLAAELLNAKRGPEMPPWTVFDKNLLGRVLEDHQLPETLKRFLPEDARPGVTGAVEEILGLHPSAWRLAEHTTDTILRLANLGNVILVGRGANFITAKLRPVVHVRLVAPLENRIAHLAEYHHLTQHEAAAYAKKADQGRRRYVKRYFAGIIEDPLNYTLLLNVGRMDYQAAARVIVEALHTSVERFANK
ncbi:MAG: cytidylate kinase-like family protein [Chthoniobacteraceae bacterium]|nr:cytidylate kinase-like family protein [Chthoniobacteraceae bacterium]